MPVNHRNGILNMPNFSSLNQFTNPADRVAQATGAGGVFDTQLKRMNQEQGRQDKLAQDAILNAQKRTQLDQGQARLDIAGTAEQRAQQQFEDQAQRTEAQDWTKGRTSQILAQYGNTPQAKEQLLSLQEDYRWNPDANTNQLIGKILEPAAPVQEKPIGGTITIQSPDGKNFTSIPYSETEKWTSQGWKVGKPFKDSGAGGSSSKDKGTGLVSLTDKPLAIQEKVGSWDAPEANMAMQKLQDSFGLKSDEAFNMIDQSIGSFLFDNQVKSGKLSTTIKNAGLTKNVFYEDANGNVKAVTPEIMADGLLNPDINIRTNPDGTRVMVNVREEEDRLRKYNKNKAGGILPEPTPAQGVKPVFHLP